MTLPDLTALDHFRVHLIAESHQRLTGRRLVDAADDMVAALWHAPPVIVAHDTAPDPVFFFGNARALELFEMLQADRAKLLETVNRVGFIEDYAGVRISSTGKRFRISKAIVWNLIAEDGSKHGQAAAFSDWEPVD